MKVFMLIAHNYFYIFDIIAHIVSFLSCSTQPSVQQPLVDPITLLSQAIEITLTCNGDPTRILSKGNFEYISPIEDRICDADSTYLSLFAHSMNSSFSRGFIFLKTHKTASTTMNSVLWRNLCDMTSWSVNATSSSSYSS